MELLWTVADGAGALDVAKPDIRRRLEHHFADGGVTEWEARQFVQDLKRQAPHLWPQGQAPAPGARQSDTSQDPLHPKRPVYRDLTPAEVASLKSLKPEDRLTKARELQQRPTPTT